MAYTSNSFAQPTPITALLNQISSVNLKGNNPFNQSPPNTHHGNIHSTRNPTTFENPRTLPFSNTNPNSPCLNHPPNPTILTSYQNHLTDIAPPTPRQINKTWTSPNLSNHSASWRWIPRTANQAADLVASLTVRRTCPDVWVLRPPSSLVHMLSCDGLPCPPPNWNCPPTPTVRREMPSSMLAALPPSLAG